MNLVLTSPWDSENYNVFIDGKQIFPICLKLMKYAVLSKIILIIL
jgi:hypothetical protein